MFILSKKLTGCTHQLCFHLYILLNKFGHGLCAIFYVQKGACPQIAHYQALCDLNGKIYAFSHRNLQGKVSESKCFVTWRGKNIAISHRNPQVKQGWPGGRGKFAPNCVTKKLGKRLPSHKGPKKPLLGGKIKCLRAAEAPLLGTKQANPSPQPYASASCALLALML